MIDMIEGRQDGLSAGVSSPPYANRLSHPRLDVASVALQVPTSASFLGLRRPALDGEQGCLLEGMQFCWCTGGASTTRI